MQYLFLYKELIPIEAFLLAFIITFLAIPSIVDVSRIKHLYDVPNGRTSHKANTPTLGGLAIFAGFVISSMIFLHIPDIPYIQYVIAGIIVVFFIGLKDDVIAIAPMTKFIGQLFAATIIIDLGDIRLTGLYGLFGVTDIGYYGSDLLTIFVIIAIVNAFNLIDGIDGLAAGVGILASAVFGFWFFEVGQLQLAILACALIGSLLAFAWFNVFSKKRKIFMGDIGSLLLGFIMSIFAIKFNDLNAALGAHPMRVVAAPAVSIGILIVPIYDTIRVFILRMVHGRSPFLPDREHVHHYMIELTGNHGKATAIILAVNVLFIILALLLSNLRNYQLFLILIFAAAMVSSIPYLLVKRKRKRLATEQTTT
jgi:UDP-N-acetylmuramyl pentapeptide phosphotransferase/UDP-N-acetylglucosamine-1-phosphate transferase